MASYDYMLEHRIITFTDEDAVTVSFTKTHLEIPKVFVLPTEDVNLIITSLSITGCVIESTEQFTGSVHMQAVSASP